MADYMANLEEQDVARLQRLAQLLSEGNSLVRLLADQTVTEFTYIVTPNSVEVSARLERDDARGR